MAKYLLLKHYRGGPAPVLDLEPIDRWAPADVDAHVRFMQDFAKRLEGTGEFVDAQALSPDGTFVRYAGDGRARDHRRAVRRDQGPHRGLDGHRRRLLRTRGRTRRRAVRGARPERRADLRVDRAAAVPHRDADRRRVNEVLLRQLIPAVTSVLVRRGVDFATAEDAVQEALVNALASWPDDPPADPKGWLVTVAWRRYLDVVRVRHRRARPARRGTRPNPRRARHRAGRHPAALLPLRAPGADPVVGDRAHAAGAGRPDHPPDRAGLPRPRGDDGPAHQPGQAHGLRASGWTRPARAATVLRVLYLIFNEGYSGEIDLAEEAIRLARQVAALTDDPEARGLLALMLLHHARRAARTTADGRPRPARRAGPFASGTPH